jgi:cytochrome c556
MKRLVLALTAVATLGLALPASAQFAKPEDAIKYRKAAFTVMAKHFGTIGAMVNDKIPFDAKAASVNADLVATVSHLPFDGFVAGTDTGETKAKPEIWKDTDKFKAAATKMQDATAKLASVAKGGDKAAIKAAFGDAGAACKACHDDFRNK